MTTRNISQDMSRFLMPGFDVLPMTYLNSRFVLVNSDITGFTSVDLNRGYRKVR